MHLSRCLALCTLCLSLTCTTTSSIAQTLWENGGEYVKITSRDGGNANQHPLKINPQLLARALSKMTVEPAKKSLLENDRSSKRLPLFTSTAAQRIADYISTGLHEAGPDNDVVFRSVDTVPVFGKAVGKQVFTTGRVFWHKRRLHVIFGEIHKNVKKRWLLGQEQGYRNPPEPGSRRKATALKLRVSENTGVRNATTRDGRKRLDWVIIEPRRLASADTETAEKPSTEPKIDHSVEARLKRLKHLREKQLISEREYQNKRKEILDDF